MSLIDLFRTGGWRQPTDNAPHDRDELIPDERLGTVAGRYRLVSLVAKGGMSTVYRAIRVDAEFEQVVAIKLLELPAAFIAQSTLAQVFLQEKSSLASLNHPHIATLIDAGRLSDDTPFLAMEFVDGLPLDRYLIEQQPDRLSRLLLLEQILETVAYAHSQFVAHGDLKPSNIMVRADRHVVLVDFGISQLLQESGLPQVELGLLTPAYAAPEQLGGAPPSVSTDIYQLGLIAQQLQGQRSRPSLLPRISVHKLPSLPLYGAALRSLLAPDKYIADDQWLALLAIGRRAAAETPLERYPAVQAMWEELRRLQNKQPPQAVASFAWLKPLWFLRRQRLWLIITLIVLLAGTLHQIQLSTKNRELSIALTKAERMSTFLVDIFSANDPLHQQAGQPHDISARELLERGRDRVGALVEEPEQQAELLHTLGVVYRNLGLNLDAQTLLEQALVIRRRLFGNRHLIVANTLHEIGKAFSYAGNTAKAKTYFENEIEIRLPAQGKRHPDVLAANSELAYVLANRGDLSAALALIEANIQIRTEMPEPNNVDLVTDLYWKGGFLMMQKNTDEGIEILKSVLEQYRKLEGDQRYGIGRVQGTLAYAYMFSGSYALAASTAEGALEAFTSLYGKDSPNLESIYVLQGQIALRSGDFETAELFFTRIDEVTRRTVGESSAQRVGILTEKAVALRAQGKCDESKESIELALNIARSDTIDQERRKMLPSFYQLFLLSSWGDSSALSYATDFLGIIRSEHNELNTYPAMLATIAGVLIQFNDLERGRSILEETYTALAQLPDGEAWIRSYARNVEGYYLLKAGQPNDAKALLSESYGELRRELGAYHIYTMASAGRLAALDQHKLTLQPNNGRNQVITFPSCSPPRVQDEFNKL